ncbi:MAG TPA: hypothetical protein VLA93_03870 [Pyrinomonadaceae bacterium]|nr:hypothetical protein [Pyrinomonadaceae bacterium]
MSRKLTSDETGVSVLKEEFALKLILDDHGTMQCPKQSALSFIEISQVTKLQVGKEGLPQTLN